MSNYPKENLYSVLGVSSFAKEEEISKAWKKKVREYHPDDPDTLTFVKSKYRQRAGESSFDYEERMIKQRHHINTVINRAKEVLSDQFERKEYDRWKGMQRSNASSTKPSSYSSSGTSSKEEPQEKTIFPEGEEFMGDLVDGVPHGFGSMTWPNGSEYFGEWVQGLQHGQGTMLYEDGQYEGSWEYGVYHGQGKYVWSNGDVYEGDFRNGDLTGQGNFSGSLERYEGDFLRGEQHGSGKKNWSDGREYEGEWAFDVPNGFGKMKYANGQEEIGHWVDGIYQGLNRSEKDPGCFGKIINYQVRPFLLRDPWGFLSSKYGISGNKEIYVQKGFWGQGRSKETLTLNQIADVYSSGFILWGDVEFEVISGISGVSWKSVWYPKRHVENLQKILDPELSWKKQSLKGRNLAERITQEKTLSANLVVIVAVIIMALLPFLKAPEFIEKKEKQAISQKEDVRNYHGYVVHETGSGFRISEDRGLKDIYKGSIRNGRPHTMFGHGSLTFNSGAKYVGEFVNGKMSGKGMFRWANGDRYEGEFVNGDFHGQGKVKCGNGFSFEGNFEKNQIIENGISTEIKGCFGR